MSRMPPTKRGETWIHAAYETQFFKGSFECSEKLYEDNRATKEGVIHRMEL
jgi:hypothetical protein